MKQQREKTFQTFRGIFRIEDFFKYSSIKHLDTPDAGTAIKKGFLIFLVPAQEQGSEILMIKNLLTGSYSRKIVGKLQNTNTSFDRSTLSSENLKR